MEWPTCPPPSSPSPATPAAAETVLPHADIDPTQLANQASHLTLSAIEPGSPSLLASSAAPPPSEPDSQDSPLRQATSCWIEPLSESTPSTPITISTPGPAAAAQPVPHTSHDHTREELLMRDGRSNAVGQEKEGVNPWPAPGADSGCRELIISGRNGMDPRPRFVNSNAIVRLSDLPNEVLLHILGFLDVPDLLATSRTSHQFRSLAVAPILHRLRLRHVRTMLPPLLTSPSRPSLLDLIHRSIFLTHTTVVSRQLARSLTAIRLSRRLAASHAQPNFFQPTCQRLWISNPSTPISSSTSLSHILNKHLQNASQGR